MLNRSSTSILFNTNDSSLDPSLLLFSPPPSQKACICFFIFQHIPSFSYTLSTPISFLLFLPIPPTQTNETSHSESVHSHFPLPSTSLPVRFSTSPGEYTIADGRHSSPSHWSSEKSLLYATQFEFCSGVTQGRNR